MFSDRFQAKAIIATFGTLGVVCLIGALWNPWQLMFAGMCAAMVLCGFSELKNVRNESEQRETGKPGAKTVESLGTVPADQFPEITEEQQQIIPPFEAVEVEQPTGIFEILPGMTVEEMTAMFSTKNVD